VSRKNQRGYVLWKCQVCPFEMQVMGENKAYLKTCPECKSKKTKFIKNKDLREKGKR